jgi:transposase InsO family protein
MLEVSLAFSQKLLENDISGSIGRFGAAYDNALMESTIGLYKTELIHAGRRAWTSRQEVERPPPPGWRGSISTGCTPLWTT